MNVKRKMGIKQTDLNGEVESKTQRGRRMK